MFEVLRFDCKFNKQANYPYRQCSLRKPAHDQVLRRMDPLSREATLSGSFCLPSEKGLSTGKLKRIHNRIHIVTAICESTRALHYQVFVICIPITYSLTRSMLGLVPLSNFSKIGHFHTLAPPLTPSSPYPSALLPLPRPAPSPPPPPPPQPLQ